MRFGHPAGPPRSTSPPQSRRHRSRSRPAKESVTPRAVPATVRARTHVADVNPTFTIAGEIICAEPVNERVAWTAEGDGTIRVRSLPKGTELKTIVGRPDVQCGALLYVQSEQQVWAAFDDGYVRVYDVPLAAQVAEFVAHENGAGVTAMIEVEGSVYTAGEDNVIMHWSPSTRQRMRVLRGHTGSVRCLGCYLGPTGSVLFSGSDDGAIRAWDPYTSAEDDAARDNGYPVPDAESLFTFTGHEPGSTVRAIEVVNAANMLWTAGDDATVRVWDLESLQCAATLRAHRAPVTSLMSVESRVWSGDLDGRIVLWDVNSLTPLQELSSRAHGGARAPSGGAVVTMRKMQPSTSWRVWTSGGNGVVQCWNAETVPILFNKGSRRDAPGTPPATAESLQTQRGARTGEQTTTEKDAAAWQQLQRELVRAGSGDAERDSADASAHDRRPSLGIVDIRRLAEEMGFERGRLEVQRELQTQQLLEEENAQLKRRIGELHDAISAPVSARDTASGSRRAARSPSARNARAAPVRSRASSDDLSGLSAVLSAESAAADREAVRTQLQRTFPGEDWAYLIAEKPHELHSTFREETSSALGVPVSQIASVSFAQGSLVASVEVQHHGQVPGSEMKRRFQAYTYTELQRLHDTARTQPKTGLDAAEAELSALRKELATAAATADEDEQQRGISPAPREPAEAAVQGPGEREEELSRKLAEAEANYARSERERDSIAKIVGQLQEENHALLHAANSGAGSALRRPSPPPVAPASAAPTPDQLAAKEDENRQLQQQLDAAKKDAEYLQHVISEKDHQRAELEKAVTEMRRGSVGTPRGSVIGGSTPLARPRPTNDQSSSPPHIDNTINKPPRPFSLLSGDGAAPDQPFRSPSEDMLMPPPSALAPSRTSALPNGSGTEKQQLESVKAELADLQQEHAALDQYLQTVLKPLISRLKRSNGERELDVKRLEKEKADWAAGRSLDGSVDRAPLSAVRGGNDSDASSSPLSISAAIANDAAALRRELRKVQCDAAAKGTALRKVQREFNQLQRAAGTSQGSSAAAAAAAAPDAAESSRLRADLAALSARVQNELQPTIAQLKKELGARDRQLADARGEITRLRDALSSSSSNRQEISMRDAKITEAVDTLRKELMQERQLRATLEQQLASAHGGLGGSKSPSRDGVVGRPTQPAFMDGSKTLRTSVPEGVEAQNLALSVRLSDAESVITDLQMTLQKTSAQLEAQRKETDRLMNIIVDLQEGK